MEVNEGVWKLITIQCETREDDPDRISQKICFNWKAVLKEGETDIGFIQFKIFAEQVWRSNGGFSHPSFLTAEIDRATYDGEAIPVDSLSANTWAEFMDCIGITLRHMDMSEDEQKRAFICIENDLLNMVQFSKVTINE